MSVHAMYTYGMSGAKEKVDDILHTLSMMYELECLLIVFKCMLKMYSKVYYTIFIICGIYGGFLYLWCDIMQFEHNLYEFY